MEVNNSEVQLYGMMRGQDKDFGNTASSLNVLYEMDRKLTMMKFWSRIPFIWTSEAT